MSATPIIDTAPLMVTEWHRITCFNGLGNPGLRARGAAQGAAEQLMAFTVTSDHARQAQLWEAVENSWNKEPVPSGAC